MGKEDYESVVISSAGQFINFLESTIWTDIKGELNIWLEGVRDGLEDTNSDEKDLFRNQGRADAVRYMLSLPEAIKDFLIEKQHSRDNENEIKDENREGGYLNV